MHARTILRRDASAAAEASRRSPQPMRDMRLSMLSCPSQALGEVSRSEDLLAVLCRRVARLAVLRAHLRARERGREIGVMSARSGVACACVCRRAALGWRGARESARAAAPSPSAESACASTTCPAPARPSPQALPIAGTRWVVAATAGARTSGRRCESAASRGRA
eukprot:3925358-Prymnesium_polylepis.2